MAVMPWKRVTIKPSVLPASLLTCFLLSVGSALAAQGAGNQESDPQARAWAYSCVTCHGAAHSPTKGIPTLAGMPTDDIVKAMLSYASGERPGLLKLQIARGYDEAVLRRIGKWYENLPRSQEEQP